MKNSEILQCLEELNIDMSKTELTEPERFKEKLRKVFWQLLEVCCGVSEEEIKGRLPRTDHLEYAKELHDPEQHGYVDMLFFQELRQLLKTCGVLDFSWKDLHMPKHKRLRIQLSAIFNLAKFREEQLKVYAELAEPRHEVLGLLEEKHVEHEHLAALLQQAQAASDIQMAEYDEVAAQCMELEREIAKSNKLQAAKREEAAQLKKQVNALKDELATSSWTLQELQAQEEGLAAQIVSSPDRRRRQLDEKKQALEHGKAETRRMQQEIADGKTKMVRLKQAIQDLKHTMVLQQEVLEEARKYQEAADKVQTTLLDVKNTQAKTDELEEKTDEAERSLMRLEEKLMHMRKQAKMKMDAVLDRIDIGNEQLLIVERERREAKARVEAGEAQVRTLQAQMEAERLEGQQELSKLVEEYRALEQFFYQRNDKRMAAVEAAK